MSAGPGDLVVLGPGVPHRYGVQPGAPAWQFWWVHCQARPAWAPWLRPYDRGDGLYALTTTPAALHDRVGAAFQRMLADARWTGSGALVVKNGDDGDAQRWVFDTSKADLQMQVVNWDADRVAVQSTAPKATPRTKAAKTPTPTSTPSATPSTATPTPTSTYPSNSYCYYNPNYCGWGGGYGGGGYGGARH